MTSELDKEIAIQERISDRIVTLPNLITMVRLLLIPTFLVLLFGYERQAAALVVYAVAACTDWVDGMVARATDSVSKFGKLLDPLVDRLLLASGVIAVCLLGRLPLWILILLIARDLIILVEGRILLSYCGLVPSVLYVGKFATAFLMFGFCLLLLGMPMVPGLGLFEVPWLPGWGGQPALLGIWFIYAGIICSVIAFAAYQVKGFSMALEHRMRKLAGSDSGDDGEPAAR